MLMKHRGVTVAASLMLIAATSIAQQPSEPVFQEQNTQARDLQAEGDPNKHYFLIGATKETKPPEDGYKLLLVLPGGDGSADFQPFVGRIWDRALGPGYLVAQLVSKEWTPGQFERLVWPTSINPWQGMKFSTEQFADAVIQDVKSKVEVNAECIYVLAWSSGGPAAYAMTLRVDNPIKGAFIAMSVFKPRQLPKLENAKGQAFYLLHSPEDFIPMAIPEQALTLLREHGATVRLETYPGGHGWKGDIFGTIRTGMKWLTEQSTSH